MTAEDLAHREVFRTPHVSGLRYGEWLVGQTLPKVVEHMGKDADPKEIAARTMTIVNEMLTRMTSE